MGGSGEHERKRLNGRMRGGMRLAPFLPVAAMALLLVISLAAESGAAFHEQLAIDPVAISLANTVTAYPPGIMAVHYNPAGLSKMPEGKFLSQGLSIPVAKITSRFEADPEFKGFMGLNNDPLAGSEATNSSGRMYIPFIGPINFLFAPGLGISVRSHDSRWTFALAQYAPFGAGINHGDADAARFGGQAVYHQHLIYAAPAVSYRVSDTLSVGASVGLGQSALGVKLDMRSPSDMVAMTKVLGDNTKDLEIPILSELTFPPPWFGGGVSPYDRMASASFKLRDDFSPSYNLGLLWEPFDWFSAGLVYQSPIKANLKGSYTITYSEQWQRMVNWFGSSPTLMMISGMLGLPTRAVPVQSGTVMANLEFPQTASLGIMVRPFERLRLLGDLHWANWSALKQDKFQFDQDIQLLQFVKVLGYTGGNRNLVMQRNFRDTLNWGVGLEYQLLDWLALRFGYENRKSSNQKSLFDLLYPIPDLDSYGAGIGIKLKSGTTVDLGFGYLVNKGFTVKNNESSNFNATDFTKPVYNPYAGLNYRQDTEIYIGSVKITMPMHSVTEMMHHQMEMLEKVMRFLNPFG